MPDRSPRSTRAVPAGRAAGPPPRGQACRPPGSPRRARRRPRRHPCAVNGDVRGVALAEPDGTPSDRRWAAPHRGAAARADRRARRSRRPRTSRPLPARRRTAGRRRPARRREAGGARAIRAPPRRARARPSASRARPCRSIAVEADSCEHSSGRASTRGSGSRKESPWSPPTSEAPMRSAAIPPAADSRRRTVAFPAAHVHHAIEPSPSSVPSVRSTFMAPSPGVREASARTQVELQSRVEASDALRCEPRGRDAREPPREVRRQRRGQRGLDGAGPLCVRGVPAKAKGARDGEDRPYDPRSTTHRRLASALARLARALGLGLLVRERQRVVSRSARTASG